MNIKIISDDKDFLALESDWQRLFAESGLENPFLSWPWVRSWWECIGRPRGDRLRLLVAYDDVPEAPAIGILPMALELTSVAGWTFSRLTVAGAGLVIDHLDVVAALPLRDAVAAAFVPFLLDSARHEGDIVELNALAATGALASALTPVLCASPGIPHWVSSEVAPCLVLPADCDQFHAALSKKLRSNIKRGRKRLETRAGAATGVMEVQHAHALPAALSVLQSLHQGRQQEKGNAGVFKDPHVRAFHRQVAPELLRAGWLRFYCLQAGAMPVAAMYCFQVGRTMSYYMGGFAREWSDGSPGAVLVADVIASAIGNGCNRFDFLRGEETYKALWTTESQADRRYTLATTRLGRAWMLGRGLRHWAGHVGRRLLAGRVRRAPELRTVPERSSA